MNFSSLLTALRMYSTQAALVLSALATYFTANPQVLDMLPKWVAPTVAAGLGILSWIGRTIPQPAAAAKMRAVQVK